MEAGLDLVHWHRRRIPHTRSGGCPTTPAIGACIFHAPCPTLERGGRMRRSVLTGTLVILTLALFTPRLSAQVLHVNNRWDNCAMVIDPTLTQEAWHQFVKEVGLVAYFRPLAGARPRLTAMLMPA